MYEKEKKKILVLTSTFPRWKNDATPPFIYELEKRLTKDFEINILAPHYQGAKKEEMMDGLHIQRFQYFWPEKLQKLCYEGGILPSLKHNKFLYIQAMTLIIFELIAAIKLCKKNKFDLIHAHWIIPQGIIAYLINKLFKIPYIVTSHGGDIYGLSGKYFSWIKKIIVEKAKTITVVSTAIKKEIEDKLTKNVPIEVIPMGVDSKLFNPSKYDESIKKKYKVTGPFLLFVGRLVEKKGVAYLIKAMPKILKEKPKTKLMIIGTGPEKNRLISLTDKLNIHKNIIFIGSLPHSELPKYYATADYFISLSVQGKDGDRDGLPTSLIEASFSGCIPITTKFDGFSDLIKNNITGYLIDIKKLNSIVSLVKKTDSNNGYIKEMKENIRKESIPKFDINIVANKFEKIYLKL